MASSSSFNCAAGPSTSRGTSVKQHVPYEVDGVSEDKYYEIKIGNVYDPTKFWIITKPKASENWTKLLFSDYETSKRQVPTDRIETGLICIVHKNKGYHRAEVLSVISEKEYKVRIFMLDIGLFVNAAAKDLYYLRPEHATKPRYAIRACLAEIAPPGNAQHWNVASLQHFLDILSDKFCYALIDVIDPIDKRLFVDLYVRQKNDKTYRATSVTNEMIRRGMAINADDFVRRRHPESKCKCQVEYPYMFPIFEYIEKGLCPSSIWEQKMIEQNERVEGMFFPKYKPEHMHLPE